MLYKFMVDGRWYAYDVSKNRIAGLSHEQHAEKDELVKGVKVYVELTGACNLSCRYCYLSTNNKTSHDLQHEDKYAIFTKALDRLIAENKHTQIVFFGGEPLLEKNLIRRLIENYDTVVANGKANVSYAMTTNGTLLDEEFSRYLIDKGVQLTVSLDGGAETMQRNRGVSRIDSIENVLKMFADAENPAAVLSTVSSGSIHCLKSDLDYLLQLPVKSIKYLSCDTTCSALYLDQQEAMRFCDIYESTIKRLMRDEEYSYLKKLADLISIMEVIDSGQVRKRICGYGYDVFALSQAGELFPCPCFINIHDYVIGTKAIRYPPMQSSVDCKNCIARIICQGGCHFTNYIAQKAGNEFMKAKCIIKRYFVEAALRTYVRLYVR